MNKEEKQKMFWQDYLETLPPERKDLNPSYEAWSFCDNEADANELGDLVLRGIKKATCSMVWSFEYDHEELPEPGCLSMITDWAGNPLCIIESTDIHVCRFNEVDAEFAATENEGDGSLEYWREAHIRAFTRECKRINRTFDENMLVVCERFHVIYPLAPQPIPDESEVYRSQAEQYDELISREDYQHNILPALQGITSFEGKNVVDLGAGTGRLICQLAPIAKAVRGFDTSQHMLDVGIDKLHQSGLTNWSMKVADHRQVDVEDGWADIIVSGWSVCYIVVDHHDTWQIELNKVFSEMKRILKPGGMIILLETQGTGFTQPEAPQHLHEYYRFLKAQGFAEKWIRTDYQFADMDEARRLATFFFGESMIEKICQSENGVTLPECTGLWWKKPLN